MRAFQDLYQLLSLLPLHLSVYFSVSHIFGLNLLLFIISLPQRVEKEHRDVLLFKQIADDSRTPLILAQVEIDNLKKELLSANRLESALAKKAEKVCFYSHFSFLFLLFTFVYFFPHNGVYFFEDFDRKL